MAQSLPLQISREVQDAISLRKGIVALESTIISHGAPLAELAVAPLASVPVTCHLCASNLARESAGSSSNRVLYTTVLLFIRLGLPGVC